MMCGSSRWLGQLTHFPEEPWGTNLRSSTVRNDDKERNNKMFCRVCKITHSGDLGAIKDACSFGETCIFYFLKLLKPMLQNVIEK